MAVYIVLALLLFLARNSKSNKLYLFFLAALFIVASFRGYSVGTDTLAYEREYEQGGSSWITIIEMAHNGEFLFAAIYFICANLGLSFRAVLIVQSLFFLIPLAICFKKCTDKPILALLLLFLLGYYFHFFNGSRQMIATAFVLSSFLMYQERKIPAVLLMTIAVITHITALLAIPILFVNKLKFNRLAIIIILLVSYVFPYFIGISDIIVSIVSRYDFFSAFDRYLLTTSTVSGLPVIGTGLTLLYISMLVLDKKLDVNDNYFKICIIGLIFRNFLISAPEYTVRLLWYFDFFQIVFFTNLYRRNSIYKVAFISYSLITFIYYFVIQGYDDVIPYAFSLAS